MNKPIGHGNNREKLKKLFAENKLASTMLFTGTEGIGKLLVAKELAQTFFCLEKSNLIYGGCKNCKNCKLFEVNNLPDFHIVEARDKEVWNTESLRDLLYRLNLASFSGKYKVLVINDAENIHNQAANVLLKSLEEPRPNMHYILISANPSKLPNTVISRCQVWNFNDLTISEINEIIKDNFKLIENIDSKILQDLVNYASGSIKNLALISENFELWNKLNNILDDLVSGNKYVVNNFVQNILKNSSGGDLTIILELIQNITRSKMIRAKNLYEQNYWANILHNSCLSFYYINQRNLNAKYLLTQILISSPDDLETIIKNNIDINYLENVIV